MPSFGAVSATICQWSNKYEMKKKMKLTVLTYMQCWAHIFFKISGPLILGDFPFSKLVVR
jgi:hypothetical protein